MADLSALWTDIPDCPRWLCDMSEGAVRSLEYHYLAVISYLTIIGVIAAAVLKRDYFDDKLFNKLRIYKVDTQGAKDVWQFTILIFLFNAILHAAQLTDADILIKPWEPPLSWLTGFRVVYTVGNFGLGLWAASRFRRDAAQFDSDDKKKKLLIAYFKPVFVLWAVDDTISKNWDFLRIKDGIQYLLDDLQNRHGWVVPITLILFTAIVFAFIMLELRWQQSWRKWEWKVAVYSVPRAIPITAAISGLAICFGGVYFLLGAGNRGTAVAGSAQTTAPVAVPKMDTKPSPLFD